MTPPPLVKASTSADAGHLTLLDSKYANFLIDYEWRNFKETYNQMKSSSLITTTNCSSDYENETEMKVKQLRQLFRERSSLLYHDIVEAVRCSEIAQSAIDVLLKRHDNFSKQAEILAERLPNMAEEIDCRLKLVQFQLQTLVCCSSKNCDVLTTLPITETITPLEKFRQWLNQMVNEVNSITCESTDNTCNDRNELQFCLTKQQELQVKIQQEGAILLRGVRKYFKYTKNENTSISSRKRVVLSSLEKRWHGLWINCLERQCRYEQFIRRVEQGLNKFVVQSENDLFIEPASKRQRLDSTLGDLSTDCFDVYDNDERSSITSDTIPFSENEYESFMDHQADSEPAHQMNLVPVLNLDSDVEYCNDKGKLVYNRSAMVGDNEAILRLKEQGQWYPNGVEVVGQDVGYSSENSVHSSNDGNFIGELDPNYNINNFHPSSDSTLMESEMTTGNASNTLSCHSENWSRGSSPCLQRRTRIQKSPQKHYYKMTPLDTDGATDTETPRSVTTNKISDDSMYVYTKKINRDDLPLNSNNSFDFTPRDLQEIMQMLDDGYEFERNRDNDNDMFKQELERFMREGTTWKPFAGIAEKGDGLKKKFEPAPADTNSGDASSELSVDEFDRDTKTNHVRKLISTVPPNSPLDAPQCNVKRRRKRSDRLSNLVFKFPSVDPKMPTSVSESAVMTTSVTSNLSSVVFEGSDVFSDTYNNYVASAYCTLPRQNCGLGCRRKKLRARRMPRSMSDGEHLPFLNLTACHWVSDHGDKSGDDSPVQGPEVPPCTPRNSTDSSSETERDEETCNFDEGGGESMIVDEEHIAGDGSSPSTERSDVIWEWDDYKPLEHKESGLVLKSLDISTFAKLDDDYLLHMETLTCDSSPVSARTDTSETSAPALPRLPPIGLSHDSDSELEELWQIIKESQKTLRASQHALRQQSVLQQSNWADLMKTSIKHIHCLQAVLRQIFNLSGKSSANGKEYNMITDLLKQWQELMTEIQTRQPVKDEAWTALQSVMKKLGMSLQDIMEHLSNRSTIAIQNSVPTEALLHEINLLKELTDKLKEDRKELDQWVCGNIFIEQYCPELQNLARGYVMAVDRCSNQLAQLEALHSQWLEWHNSDGVCKQLLDDIKHKINALNHNEDLKFRKISADLSVKDIQGIYNDLELCEDRLCRLETMCNDLTSASMFLDSGVILDLKQQLTLYSRQLETLKNDFEKLPNAQAIKEKSLPSEVYESQLVQRKKSSTTVFDAINKQTESDRILSTNFLWRLVSYSWPVQLILILLVCLGIYLLQPFCCQTQNNWGWSFGPQLNYVRGPPPT